MRTPHTTLIAVFFLLLSLGHAEYCSVRCSGNSRRDVVLFQPGRSVSVSRGGSSVLSVSVARCSRRGTSSASSRGCPMSEVGRHADCAASSIAEDTGPGADKVCWEAEQRTAHAVVDVKCEGEAPILSLSADKKTCEVFVSELLSTGACSAESDSSNPGKGDVLSKKVFVVILGSIFFFVFVATAAFEYKIDGRIAGESCHQLL